MAFLTSILTAYGLDLLLGGSGAALSVWLFGRFSSSTWSRTLRGKYGRAMQRFGQAVSKIGNSRLGNKVSEPIEDFASDWVGFGVSEFFVGLRKDNVKKMEKQLDRMEDVESVTRAKALRERLEHLRHLPGPMSSPQDAAIAHRLRKLGEESIKNHLNQ